MQTKQFVITLGIEHLMTGVKVRSEKGDVLTFERESASVVRVLSDSPIEVYWPVKQAWLSSHEVANWKGDTPYTGGQVEWYAQVVAPSLVDVDQRSYDMQTYNRIANFTGPDGVPTRYAPGEPSRFPEAVVNAMRSRFGAQANQWLSKLQWTHDHWSFTMGNMYVGVEPDGYIHT